MYQDQPFSKKRIIVELQSMRSELLLKLDSMHRNRPDMNTMEYEAHKTEELALRRRIYCLTVKIENIRQNLPINGHGSHINVDNTQVRR